MPELPEVEVARQSVASRIVGSTVQAVQLGKPLRWPLQIEAKHLVGRRIVAVGRRGKYLLFHMNEGVLLVHLGMSGSIRFADALPPAGVHDHFTLSTTQGLLRLHDPRRFGAVVYSAALDHAPATTLLSHLGVEPLSLDFDEATFVKAVRGKKTPIKQVLLAGQLVVVWATSMRVRCCFWPALTLPRGLTRWPCTGCAPCTPPSNRCCLLRWQQAGVLCGISATPMVRLGTFRPMHVCTGEKGWRA
jgi:hypothetical protein